MTDEKKESRDMETQEVTTEHLTPIEPIVEEVKSLGHYLREAREKKKLSIKVVAQHTKISVTNLQYLEDDNFDKLPNVAYVRGFVKNYAKVVDLSEQEALSIFDDALNIVADSTPTFEEVITTKETVKEEITKTSESNNSQAIKLGGVILLGFLVSFFIFKKDSPKETQPEKPEVITEKTVEETPAAKVEETSEEVKTQVETKVKEEEKIATPEPKKEKKQPVVVAQPEKKEEVKEAEKKEDKKESEKTKKKLRPVPYPLYSVSKEDGAEFLPEKYRTSVVEGKQNLFINATAGDTWITYKSDDNPVKKFVLKQGRMLIIRGDEIRIFFGNVNATKVFLNNKLLDVPTRSGVKSLVVPHNNSYKYNLPLFIYKKDGTTVPSDEIDL